MLDLSPRAMLPASLSCSKPELTTENRSSACKSTADAESVLRDCQVNFFIIISQKGRNPTTRLARPPQESIEMVDSSE